MGANNTIFIDENMSCGEFLFGENQEEEFDIFTIIDSYLSKIGTFCFNFFCFLVMIVAISLFIFYCDFSDISFGQYFSSECWFKFISQ